MKKSKLKGLIPTKYQYYLLILPFSSLFVAVAGLVNGLYSTGPEWLVKYSFWIGFGFIVMSFVMELFGFDIIAVAFEELSIGNYMFYAPISLLAIKIQESKFEFK